MLRFRIYILLSLIFLSSYALATESVSTSAAKVCKGANTVELKLNGAAAAIVDRWESSTDPGGPWTTINYTAQVMTLNNVQNSLYYRVVGHYNPTGSFSTPAVYVEVVMPPVPGSLSAPTDICSGSDVSLSLSGFSANQISWASSLDGVSWNTISGNASTKLVSNVSIATYFRASLFNDGCPEQYSNSVKVSVSAPTVAGTIDGDRVHTAGNVNGTLTLSGYTGAILHWESSSSTIGPWSVVNATSASLSYSQLANTQYYRALVQSGTCNAIYTNTVEVKVVPAPTKGFVYGSTTVCDGANSGTLGVYSYTGSVSGWEYSTDKVSWLPINTLLSDITFQDITATTYYRAKIKNEANVEVYSDLITIAVAPNPVAKFSSKDVCEGTITPFTNLSSIASGSIKRYEWDFGDGTGSSTLSPMHKFETSGNYTVKLTTESDAGCVSSFELPVNILKKPSAHISLTNTCLNSPAELFDNSISNGVHIATWTFGDGASLQTSDASTTHSYTGDGTYEVKLKVEDTYGCLDSTSAPIQVYPLPTIDFSVHDVCLNSSSSFQNVSFIKSGWLNFQWDFGDGANGSDTNPIHKYLSAGSYKVALVATSDKGCSVAAKEKTTVVRELPATSFDAPSDICFKQPYSPINSSAISGGASLTYKWNFGDGQISSDSNPTYLYRIPGKYSVSLEATSSDGCIASTSKDVVVNSLPVPAFTVTNVCFQSPLVFHNESSSTTDNTTYKWNFGTEGESTQKEPEYAFANPGSYTVSLYATSGSCIDSVKKEVVVYPKPTADFVAVNACDGFPVKFQDKTASVGATIASYSWDFGDRTNSVQQNPEKEYLNPGDYTVVFGVVNSFGCGDQTTRKVSVYERPTANFVANNACIGSVTRFENTSFGNDGTIAYTWDFGDGNSSDQYSTDHTYATAGDFNVEVKANTNYGCADSIIRKVYVYSLPQVSAGKDTTISRGSSIKLNGSGASKYFWSPAAEFDFPNIPDPLVTPKETTLYHLLGEDAYGCIDSASVTVSVTDDYHVSATNIITPDGNGENDYWVVDNIASYPNTSLSIYDRWGNEVYSCNGYNNNWGGTNKNGDVLPDGTYYYVLRFNDNGKVLKGGITLIRNK